MGATHYHSRGLRARTRNKFSKAYKSKGRPRIARYLTQFKRGDYVDIKADASVQKGMPYQFYHGRTGVVFNVTKQAVGVEVTKIVNTRQLKKRIHVRIEHVRKSRCNEDFLRRVKTNDPLRREAKKSGKKVDLKRVPPGPKAGKIIKADEKSVEVLAPIPFVYRTL